MSEREMPHASASKGNSRITTFIADKTQWEKGVNIILKSQQTTSLPDPATWPPERLAEHTRGRQENAINVWLAEIEGETVGHALLGIIPADHKDWSRMKDPVISDALKKGNLIEMGGLAVLPEWYKHGIADTLIRARLEWMKGFPEKVVCASIWQHSQGSQALANKYAKLVTKSNFGPYDLVIYNT